MVHEFLFPLPEEAHLLQYIALLQPHKLQELVPVTSFVPSPCPLLSPRMGVLSPLLFLIFPCSGPKERKRSVKSHYGASVVEIGRSTVFFQHRGTTSTPFILSLLSYLVLGP